MQDINLLETMLYINRQIYLKEYHLQRLYYSIKKINFKPLSLKSLNRFFLLILEDIENKLSTDYKDNTKYCIRLLLNKNGEYTYTIKLLDDMPLQNLDNNYIQLTLAKSAININYDNKFLWLNKTDIRNHYNDIIKEITVAEMNINAKFTDIILYNRHGHITEATKANIAIITKNNQILTPFIHSVLLAGTMRQYLLNHQYIQCANITINDLINAKSILWFNSLRGIYKAKLI